MTDTDATIVIAVVMIIGLAGTVVPVLPGLVVLWGAALIYGFMVGFGAIGIAVMVVLTLLLIASVAKSIVLPKRMASDTNVPLSVQLLAFVGAVAGTLVMPVIGSIVGALLVLFIVEAIRLQALAPAWTATVAVAKAFGLSALIDVALGLVMITLWGFWALTVV